MKPFHFRMTALFAAASFVLGASYVSAAAQSGPSWGQGMMMGPGMMGAGMMWGAGMCNPRAAGLAEWRMEQIEQRVEPNDEQRAKLKELRDVSANAAKVVTAACPNEIPSSPITRLELMEKRLNAMVEAIKIVRPAFENFYNSLTKEQQAELERVGPRDWGWQHWR